MNDRWSLAYTPEWVKSPQAFPLSPALPLKPPAAGHAPGAVKRFIENLLPEGRALDITATTYRLSKSNIYALISAPGTETTGPSGAGGRTRRRRPSPPRMRPFVTSAGAETDSTRTLPVAPASAVLPWLNRRCGGQACPGDRRH